MSAKQVDPATVGVGKTYPTMIAAVEAAEGTYKGVADDSEALTAEEESQNPKGPDPLPFKLGPLADGQR